MKRHDLTNVFILLTFRFVLSDYIYTFRNALKNPLLENINKITYKLWDGKQCSKMCCYVTCISYQHCKSFAFNSDSEWCQIFSKDFRNEPISGTALASIVHYDLMNGKFSVLLLRFFFFFLYHSNLLSRWSFYVKCKQDLSN